MPKQTEWERVDERVLDWVASLPPSRSDTTIYDLRSWANDGDRPVEGLEPGEVGASLGRLCSYGFVSGREDGGLWWRLRLAPLGLVYRGEWPDVELATSAVALSRVLRGLADTAPPEDGESVARAAGFIGRAGDAIVRGTLGDIAHDLGEEIGG